MISSEVDKTKKILQDKAPEIFKNYSVLFGYLYGSYARGDVHPFSDVDIGIYLEDNISTRKALEN